MKTILLVIFFSFFTLNSLAQEITLTELYEIVNCGKSCYQKIVKEHSYSRLDDDDGAAMSKNENGNYLRYGPKNAPSKINSVAFFSGSNRLMGIIFTDDRSHWYSFYEQISTSEKYYRVPAQEGSTTYKDYVFQRVGYPNYKFTFIEQTGHDRGDYSFLVGYHN